mgnify:CR=1 FL=1
MSTNPSRMSPTSPLSYTRHHAQRASNGGEDGNEEFEDFFVIEFHVLSCEM